MRARLIPWLLMLALVLSFALLTPAAAQPVSQSIRLPNQEYTESREDIKVKVLGGYVRINRSWVAGRWYLNPAWANLRFIADPMGGVLAVDRAASLYERTAGGTGSTVYAFGSENFIAKQGSGWRWYDRGGNSIDYDESGRILAYTNPAGVKVSFEYTAGHMSRVLDHQGQPALAIQTDTQGRVTQVSDATPNGGGRSVQYTWSGAGISSQLTQVTHLLGQAWKYEYNATGQITQRTDPLSATVQLTYMSNPPMIPDSPGFAGMGAGGATGGGSPTPTTPSSSTGSTKVIAPQVARVASYKDETGASSNYRIEWDRVRRQYTLLTQEPSGLQRTQVYDKDGLILRDSAGGLTSTQRSVDSATQERLTDARGLTTTIQYDAARRPLKTIYPDGSSETSQYDTRAAEQDTPTPWASPAPGAMTPRATKPGTSKPKANLSNAPPSAPTTHGASSRAAPEGQGKPKGQTPSPPNMNMTTAATSPGSPTA